ncbi:MAG: Na/Pi cotransporter family protein [Thermodesulfobacteriota bacterium]|nr:Na/Pi cotransporter family protein [Thermodesulfobacteriota bacterium]
MTVLLPDNAGASSSKVAIAGAGDISWFLLIAGMLGGLALFLYGLEKMSEGLRKAAGQQMRNILAALTRNRVVAMFAGAFVTTVIQSSSATTVILVSFVQAGLMSFAQSLGVILGADIGTTITAQLIAFKLTDSALVMVAAGSGLRMFAKRPTMVTIGDIILGFGLLFYGMKLMSDAMIPLRGYEGFIHLLYGLEHPVMGLLVGMVFTALIQSSSAFTGIVIVLAQQGLITLEAGIPMVFGANIGTCITAGLASIGMSRDAKRVAIAHVLFKVTGVLLFIFWIPRFADMIRGIAGHISADPGRQIANAHTIFNVSMALVFLPFTETFAVMIQKILPDRKGALIARDIRTWYLDDSCIDTPEVAIGLARAELSRMAKLLERMLRAVIIPFMSDERLVGKNMTEKDEVRLLRKEIPTRDEIFPELTIYEGLDMREEKIDFLEEKIGDYLNKVLRHNISERQVNEVFGMMSIAKDLESIGDIIHRNILPLVEKKRQLDSDFSEEGKEELLIYHDKVCRRIRLLKQAFLETDQQQSCRIMGQERKYLDLESQYRLRHLDRVRHQHEESLATHEVHMELLDLMKQIMVYSAHIAETFSRNCVLTIPAEEV